jgi:hypothetical protein
MRKRLLEALVVQWQKGPALQLPDKGCKPKTANRERGDNVRPTESQRTGSKGRNHQPVKVDRVHSQYERGYKEKWALVLLHIAEKERKEWQHEVEYDQE